MTRRISLLFFLVTAALPAQSIAVSPANAMVGVGQSRQFVASVTGMEGAPVAWSVSAGSISGTGLFAAPQSQPPQNPIKLTAKLAANPAVSASVYVYILNAGPTVTGVTPNPIPSGSSAITVTGSGFLPGAAVLVSGVAYAGQNVTPTSVSASIYLGAVSTATVSVRNPDSTAGNTLVLPVKITQSPSGGSNAPTVPPTISPATALVVLGATQQFTASGPVSWTSSAGTVSGSGLYTAPAVMPASAIVTVTASNTAGQTSANVALISNLPPSISQVSPASLPQGVFAATVTGAGFIPQTVATLNGLPTVTTFVNANTLRITGYAGTAGTGSLVVSNGPVASSPFPLQVGVQNPRVSAAAARRFLEQAAFGPTPAEAARVQQLGFQGWLEEQFSLPVTPGFPALGNQGGMAQQYLANIVNRPDQLRQRVAFALSQILVTSLNKLIWNPDMIPYQDMLLADALTNYRKILYDVTLSPSMGHYLDMANNARANPAAGTVANENYAREVLQLFSLGTSLLNPDGATIPDANNLPTPTYTQADVAEFARVFTGWTYNNTPPRWPAYINQSGPLIPYPSMHDPGAKTLLNGFVSPAGISPQADLDNAINNIFSHQNIAPFVGRLLIQHLVKSNPSPAYLQRVSAAFVNNGQGVRGDMKAVITAILLDPEARENDSGGADRPADGHLQEPVLFLAGVVRAFGGTMTNANYYSSEMAAQGQDMFNSPSVFNFYQDSFQVPGMNLTGGEFQIYTPNNSILRANMVAALFSAYSNTTQSNGPGTTIDLAPYVSLASSPALLADALDLTLTHGTMPPAMKQVLISTMQADTAGSLHRTQTGIWLILTSSFYNVWH